MKLIYKNKNTGEKQVMLASLFELDINDVPCVDNIDNFFQKLLAFIGIQEYRYEKCLYNSRLVLASSKADMMSEIKKYDGVSAFFIGITQNPDSSKDLWVIIDKEYNIVNPIYEKFVGKAFPLKKRIGYSGIKQVLIINKRKDVQTEKCKDYY